MQEARNDLKKHLLKVRHYFLIIATLKKKTFNLFSPSVSSFFHKSWLSVMSTMYSMYWLYLLYILPIIANYTAPVSTGLAKNCILHFIYVVLQKKSG